jgi:uncharacterized membrane protein
LNRVLTIILGALLVCAIGGLIYISISPGAGEGFTEFYILGPQGKASDYPEKVVLGEEMKVIVGIVNREHRETSYRIEISIDGRTNNEIGPVVLAHDETWEQEVSFRPDRIGDRQKVDFLLYKDEQTVPSSERLHLWIDVKE